MATNEMFQQAVREHAVELAEEAIAFMSEDSDITVDALADWFEESGFAEETLPQE